MNNQNDSKDNILPQTDTLPDSESFVGEGGNGKTRQADKSHDGKSEKLEGVYAVHDLDDSAFDVSIVRINKMEVEVLASAGDNNLGDANFNMALIDIVHKKYEAEVKKEMNPRHFNFNHAEQEKKTRTLCLLP